MPTDRRQFLQFMTAGTVAAAFPASIARALAIPANRQTGTIADVEHIVVMMQENRSFDHYYGTMRGVRGFGDPRAIRLPSGRSVWYQPHGDSYVLPFPPPAPEMGLQFLEDLPHDWNSTHAAWNNGAHDGWVPHKGTTTMAHLTRSDIPYHFALADAFTICDAYHCSLMGPTDPNRYYMWSGWVGNDGQGGGPVVGNEESGYSWSTFPERLHRAGISWKLYQDIGLGMTEAGKWGETDDAYIGNYGDNSLLFFKQYQEAQPGTPLFAGAKTGTSVVQGDTLFAQFRDDVLANRLPQVTWIAAPEAYCEHPNWPANYGAWYVSQILDALTANPEVWSKTAFFLTYDENDGFFDHMPPPTVPPTAAHGRSSVDMRHEHFAGTHEYAAGPYGLGPRVPMLVISPWSKGGWVDSEVFDHTSILRFIERRFAAEAPELREDNITPWRRAVAGDLTSAFDFSSKSDVLVPLPSTMAYTPPAKTRRPDYKPMPPAEQALPKQEPGTRPARALPYELEVTGEPVAAGPGQGNGFRLAFRNTGNAAAVFQVYSVGGAHAPRTYTVHPGATLSDIWDTADAYDLSVHGPNGFFRGFRGTLTPTGHAVRSSYDRTGCALLLDLQYAGAGICQVRVEDAYSGRIGTYTLRPGESAQHRASLASQHGWYDLTVTASDGTAAAVRQFAGRLEDGKDGRTDPLIGGERG